MPTTRDHKLPSWTDLDEYIAHLTTPEFVEFCAARAGIPLEDVRWKLDHYAGEVAVGVKLLDGVLRPGQRVLEVGAGVGLLSVWLIRRGATIELLEVGAGGFDANRRLLDAVLEWFQVAPTVLPIKAEQLDPQAHGVFDLVFSVNVIEHIPALEDALVSMLGVLAPHGLMRHACPNYAVPYEPHLEMVLVPWLNRLSRHSLPRIAAQEEVWQSLNFITYGRVVRFCRAHHLAYRFERGLLAEALTRMEREAAFLKRRVSWVRVAQRIVRRAGLMPLVARLPPRWATPMAFSCWREGALASSSSH